MLLPGATGGATTGHQRCYRGRVALLQPATGVCCEAAAGMFSGDGDGAAMGDDACRGREVMPTRGGR